MITSGFIDPPFFPILSKQLIGFLHICRVHIRRQIETNTDRDRRDLHLKLINQLNGGKKTNQVT